MIISEITQEEFYSRLEDKVVQNAKTLLGITGVYEAVAEEFNNAILEEWEDENVPSE